MEGRQSTSKSMPPANPITHLQTRFKELETGFKAWLAKQSLPVLATVVTATRAPEGIAESVVEISKSMPPPNPITQIQIRFKELETGFNAWLAKHSLSPIEFTVANATGAAKGAAEFTFEVATVAAEGAAYGAVHGYVFGTFLSYFPFSLSTRPPQAKQAQDLIWGPKVQARRAAIMFSVQAVIYCIVKKIRGVHDVQTCMMSSFGCGAMFPLVNGIRGPNQVATAISCGLIFALLERHSYKDKIHVDKPRPSKVREELQEMALKRQLFTSALGWHAE